MDTVKASRHANMKELRPMGGNIRILFAFDPRRTAILLIGGDKTDRWDVGTTSTSRWPTTCMTSTCES